MKRFVYACIVLSLINRYPATHTLEGNALDDSSVVRVSHISPNQLLESLQIIKEAYLLMINKMDFDER